jgi:putative transcriptional regulator
LNKPLHYRLSDLIPEITSEHIVYSGGPVESDNLYFLHSLPNRIPNSVLIKDGIYWGGDFNELSNRLAVGEIDSNKIRFFLGYSGWEFGQLQGEIDADSWVVTSNEEKEKILQSPPKSMWKNQMTLLGGEFLLYANAPEDPRNN